MSFLKKFVYPRLIVSEKLGCAFAGPVSSKSLAVLLVDGFLPSVVGAALGAGLLTFFVDLGSFNAPDFVFSPAPDSLGAPSVGTTPTAPVSSAPRAAPLPDTLGVVVPTPTFPLTFGLLGSVFARSAPFAIPPRGPNKGCCVAKFLYAFIATASMAALVEGARVGFDLTRTSTSATCFWCSGFDKSLFTSCL